MRTTARSWGGAGITITYQDWDNAADMRRVLEPFKDATEALEGDYIALPLVHCIMSVLDSHIEAEIASFVSGSSSAIATEVMLLDQSDSRDELPNVNIAAALSARTKGLEWLDATGWTLWRRIVLVECNKMFQADIAEEVRVGNASNGIEGPEERGVDGGRGTQEEAVEEMISEDVCGDGEGSGCGGR